MDCELESPIAVLGGAPGGGGARRISTISNRASEATTTDQAVRPISAVRRVCWFLSTTWTSKLIRSRSTSLSSRKDSLAISMACWREEGRGQRQHQKRFRSEARSGTYVVGFAGGDVHHSRGVGIREDVWGDSWSCARCRPRS